MPARYHLAPCTLATPLPAGSAAAAYPVPVARHGDRCTPPARTHGRRRGHVAVCGAARGHCRGADDGKGDLPGRCSTSIAAGSRPTSPPAATSAAAHYGIRKMAAPRGRTAQPAAGRSRSSWPTARRVGWPAAHAATRCGARPMGASPGSEQPLPRRAGGRRTPPGLSTARGSATAAPIVLPLLVRSEGGQVVEWYASTDRTAAVLRPQRWELAQRYAVAEAAGWLCGANRPSRLAGRHRQGPVLPPVAAAPLLCQYGAGGRSQPCTGEDGDGRWTDGRWPRRGESAGCAGAARHARRWADAGRRSPCPRPSLEPESTRCAAGRRASVRPHRRRPWRAPATVRGPGFDVCDLPTLSELATWYAASPYRTVNLYLGGVLRFCANQNLTASTLATLSAQGWTFIPTWVGPAGALHRLPSTLQQQSERCVRARTGRGGCSVGRRQDRLGSAKQTGRARSSTTTWRLMTAATKAVSPRRRPLFRVVEPSARAAAARPVSTVRRAIPPIDRYASVAAPPDASGWRRGIATPLTRT